MFIGCKVKFNNDCYRKASSDIINTNDPIKDSLLEELDDIRYKELTIKNLFVDGGLEYLEFEECCFLYLREYFYIVNEE